MISLLGAGAAKLIRMRNHPDRHSTLPPAGGELAGRQWARRFAREEGSAMVEAALSCVILMMLLIGICEMSLALYSYHSVSYAAREATRWAMVRGSQCTGLTGCGASNSDIQTYLRGAALPGITSTNLSTATTWYTVTMDTSATQPTAVLTSCGTTPAGCNVPGNQVLVTVTYSFPLRIPGIPHATWTMKSTSAMVISQ